MALCYTVACILVIVALAFYTGRAVSCIEGYSDLPDEEKKAANIKPLCRNVSVMFFLSAVIFGIAGYSELFRLLYFKWAMVGWIALCCADIVFINKSGAYTKS